MADWRRLLLSYLIFLSGGAGLAALIWLLFGERETFTFSAAVTVPIVALFLVSFILRTGGPLPGSDSLRDVFGTMNGERDQSLAHDFGDSASRWLSRRVLAVAAAGAATTLLGLAVLLYFVFEIR